ncbi:MAG: DUF421 domain-containing protein [Oscillospiraceae bacterium]|nr:DUF421 domain-containing protein [Oscillospiraceae bacterium]
MVLLFFRTLLIYLFILFLMRFMGKRQLGELQPSDLASTILISNLASIPIEQPELPFLSSLIPILLIACLEIMISFFCLCWPRLESLLSGRPITVIRNGKIDQAALAEMRFSASDLVSALRSKDIFSPDEVSYAVIETDGTLSAKKKPLEDTPTRQDLNLPCTPDQKPVLPFIVNGQTLPGNLAWCGRDEAWLKALLRRKRLSPSEVFLLMGDGSDDIYLAEKEKATG